LRLNLYKNLNKTVCPTREQTSDPPEKTDWSVKKAAHLNGKMIYNLFGLESTD
jgi:hypothetical protein